MKLFLMCFVLVFVFCTYFIQYFIFSPLLMSASIYLLNHSNNNSSRVKDNFDTQNVVKQNYSLLIFLATIFMWTSAIYLTTAPYTKRRVKKVNWSSIFNHIWFVKIWMYTCKHEQNVFIVTIKNDIATLIDTSCTVVRVIDRVLNWESYLSWN